MNSQERIDYNFNNSFQSFLSAFCFWVTFRWLWSSLYPFSTKSQILSTTVIDIVLFGNLVQSIYAQITMFYRVRTGHGKPGKSWNLIIILSRPGKSWNLGKGHGKSWKIIMLSTSERQ